MWCACILDVNLIVLGVYSKLDIIYRLQGIPELASRLAPIFEILLFLEPKQTYFTE